MLASSLFVPTCQRRRLPSAALTILGLVLLLALSLPTTALAQGETGNVCVRDYRGGAVCTANDVRIEDLVVVSVAETCVAGTPGETEVVFEALVSSAGSPNRYDIGLFLALDGGSARDGDSCFHDFLEPPLSATPTYVEEDGTLDGPDGSGPETVIDGPWWNGNTDADSCGDIETNSKLKTTLPSLRFACIDNNGDGSADVSVCTSWDNNTGSACTTVVDAFPGTNSKCSCGTVELGIPPAPEITIVKSPTTQSVPLNGTADFTLEVTSKTTVSNVVVTDALCDAAPIFSGTDDGGDGILEPGETWTYTCSTANVMAGFTNTAEVDGDGPLGPVNDSDTAEVTVAEDPVIGLAKRVVSFSDAGGGLFDIALQFVVENLGNVALSNVQVVDNLTTTFPSPVTFSIQSGPSASGALTANASFDGSADQNLLVAGSSNLAIGSTQTIDVTVRINPNSEPGPWSNTSTASGDSPAMTTASDTSDDGTDPDPNGNGDPDEAGENDPTPISIVEDPVIGVAKRVTSIADAGGGQFDVAFEMVVENLGNVALSSVQVTDDLDATFPAPVTYSIQAGPTAGGTLTANGSFDGSGDQDLLVAGSSSLAVGASATIGFTVRFDPNGASGPFSNTATASGESPGGATPTDTSDDGTDPDPNGNDEPDETGENDPTPIAVPENPVIGIAKRVTSLTDAGGGQFDAAIEMVVENLGNVDLDNVQVTDDLTATFPVPATFAIQAGPAATGSLTANAGFDGDGDPSLLNAGASTLVVGATGTITFTIRFNPNGLTGPFFNTAIATGDSPLGDPTTDSSDDGTDPDPNGNDDPSEIGEDDPTPITVVEDPVIGIAKSVTSVTDAGGGQFDVAFSFVVENFGNVALSNVQITDDLTATFPAPVTFAIQAGPTAGGTLTANAGFDGDGDQNLLVAGSSSLALGASASVTLTVRITPNAEPGPWSNTALASGEGPGGGMTADTSDDGADPDPSGNGDPDEAGENDPTPISITEDPVIGIAKSVTSVTDQGGGVFDIGLAFVVENLGNVALSNVQITDDLTATFPAPVTFTIQAGPAAVGSLTANAGFDGSADQNLLVAGSSSLALGASASVTLTVRITPNAEPGPWSNTALASGEGPGGGMTADTSDDGTDPDPSGNGDPDEAGENDPTPISVTTEPILDADKSSSFDLGSQDNDASGTLTAGDDLTYTLVITNTGTGDALDVVLDDTPDANTALVAGTVTTTQGTVTVGNIGGDTSVQVDVGTLAAGGGSVTITFEVTLDDPLADGVTEIINQGVVSGSNFTTLQTNDPDTAPDDDPTVDTIASPAPPAEIPTLSEWMLLLLATLLAGGALHRLRHRSGGLRPV